MIDNYVFRLMQCFDGSFVNQHGEFIAHNKANEYFGIKNCKDELEAKCKCLEWFSRGASKTEPFGSKKKNQEFQAFMLNGINSFLGTNFSTADMRIIYQELGNGVDRDLSIKFINGGYDLSLLKPNLKTE